MLHVTLAINMLKLFTLIGNQNTALNASQLPATEMAPAFNVSLIMESLDDSSKCVCVCVCVWCSVLSLIGSAPSELKGGKKEKQKELTKSLHHCKVSGRGSYLDHSKWG